MTDKEITLAAIGVIQDANNGLELGGYYPELRAAVERHMRKLLIEAYEEVAQIADAICKEQDEWAEAESLPPDQGGNPEIAERIRALKAPLVHSTETPPQ